MAGTHWSVRHLAGPPSPAKLRHSPTTPAATNRRPTAPSLHHPRITTIHCSSLNPQNNSSATTTTPKFLRFVVAGVTEILRIFSPADDRVREKDDEILVSGVDDVIEILRSDYENAYFVTGVFTYSMYDSDCLFEDPTIKFRGTDLYYRNLKLLVPFFDGASIALKEIEKGFNSGKNFVLAKWRLRTYLMLPWRPLIVIDGSTRYDLSDEFKDLLCSMSSFRVAVELVLGDMLRHLHLHHDAEMKPKFVHFDLAAQRSGSVSGRQAATHILDCSSDLTIRKPWVFSWSMTSPSILPSTT